jgi:hypothetical protein
MLEVVVVGMSGLMVAVSAVVSSSELVMVMAVEVVVVSKELDVLHVHSPSSCGHRRQPVPLVSPVPLAQAQVYHGY